MAVHTKNDNYISTHTNALLKVRTAVLLFITLNAHTINSDAFWLAVKVFIVQQQMTLLFYVVQTQFLEGHSPAQFKFNPNKTHLIQLIKSFRLICKLHSSVLEQDCN